jgi:phosphoribosylanthranilate isomerase
VDNGLQQTMHTRVKICGITQLADAWLAVEAGADALGFVFYEPSPRFISPEHATELIRQLPPLITKIGVFVNAPGEFIRQVASACGLDALQLHGDETPHFCQTLGLWNVIKAFRVDSEKSLTIMSQYPTAAWLLDSYVADQPGGTGACFDWELARRAKEWKRPIVLAGGLTCENVSEAVRTAQPYAVDVASGVESSPGKKDPEKVRRFIAAVRAAGVKLGKY